MTMNREQSMQVHKRLTTIINNQFVIAEAIDRLEAHTVRGTLRRWWMVLTRPWRRRHKTAQEGMQNVAEPTDETNKKKG